MEVEPIKTGMLFEKIQEESVRLQGLPVEVSKVIVGQKDILDFIVIALLCNGHILLEGVPGIAKTTMIKAVSRALGLNFNRIQFTPDLLPADLIGTLIYNQKTHDFETKKGPVFSNLVLADEINRAPAKVQSALLEAMQEHQVTIGSTSFKLEEPFLVFATQNPIEQEGTYRLPEAQLDRFIFKLHVDYPTMNQEREIVKRTLDVGSLSQVLTKEDIIRVQKLAHEVYIDDKVIEYIVSIVHATRKPKEFRLKDISRFIQYGVSPRATLAMYSASKVYAFLQKRHFVTPDDIKKVCPAILRHRLLLTYEAEAEGITIDDVICKILSTIPVP